MKTLALATILLATTCAQAASDADTPPVSDDSPATQIATDADTQPASDDSPETQALNHTGTYSGTLPCAVCDGIQTKLTLNDGHYHLTRIRLGLDEDSEEISGVYPPPPTNNTCNSTTRRTDSPSTSAMATSNCANPTAKKSTRNSRTKISALNGNNATSATRQVNPGSPQAGSI